MLRRATTSPTDIASLRWWQTAFAGILMVARCTARWNRCRP